MNPFKFGPGERAKTDARRMTRNKRSGSISAEGFTPVKNYQNQWKFMKTGSDSCQQQVWAGPPNISPSSENFPQNQPFSVKSKYQERDVSVNKPDEVLDGIDIHHGQTKSKIYIKEKEIDHGIKEKRALVVNSKIEKKSSDQLSKFDQNFF